MAHFHGTPGYGVFLRILAVVTLAALAAPAAALDVVGYTAAANDRFASGFPSAPVANSSSSFIGLDYDWSGVGWSAADGTKGFGFLSPRHYLVAAHYGGATTLVLRIVGNPSNTWVGSASQSIGNRSAWGLSPPQNPPADRYVLFDAATAGGGRSVLVDSAANERGMFFKSTAATGDGFSFTGASTLTIGRGGIVNYDNARQTISAPITLGSSQYWDVGPGGVTAGAINTAGYLLEVAGSGTGILSGVVSGSGGLALSGSLLELSGSNTYSGGTWVHSGRLVVDGSITASSGVTVNAGGSLGGSGLVAALGGSGSIDPGGSPGILTAPSLDPTAGLGFNFEFTQVGPPTWGNPAASGNDVLRLQNITTPFTAALSSANAHFSMPGFRHGFCFSKCVEPARPRAA